MDPNLANREQPANDDERRDPAKDEKYAHSLLQALNAQMEIERTSSPKKPIISTKKLIFIAITVITTIVSFILITSLLKSDKAGEVKDGSRQLLNGVNSVEDLQK